MASSSACNRCSCVLPLAPNLGRALVRLRQFGLFCSRATARFRRARRCRESPFPAAPALLSAVCNIEFVTLNQRAQFLRAFAIEIDPVAMRSDLVLQSLHFAARFVDLRVDFLQFPALGRRPHFPVLRFRARSRVVLRRSAPSRPAKAPARPNDSSCARDDAYRGLAGRPAKPDSFALCRPGAGASRSGV